MKKLRFAGLLAGMAMALWQTSFAVAEDGEWIQKIPAAWSDTDAVQNVPVQVVEGKAITTEGQTVISTGQELPHWTDSLSDTDAGLGTAMSADVESIYELDLLQQHPDSPRLLDRIDLWVDNSSDSRNAVNVEIQVSYDGTSYETVAQSGNRVGERSSPETCNLLTFDLSHLGQPVQKVRIVDKPAVTATQETLSPLWLEWDVVLKEDH